MDSSRRKGKDEMPLPPPPPVVPPNVVPQKVCLPMVRRGTASRGQSIQLLTNHFNVAVSRTDGFFFHYSVAIKYEDDTPVDAKGVGRSILDKVYRTYGAELAGKKFAYDGEKSLFTVGSLPQNKFEFTVIMEDASSSRASGTRGSPGGDGDDDQKDKKRMRKQARSKTYKVAINYAAKIPIQSIVDALNGKDSDHFQGAVRVLDIILRQHAAKQGCLLVRQSFFHDQPRNFVDIGGGVYGCRGFHSSFRATQGGLSLNMDVSTTMIVKPVSVIQFLLENQTVKHHSQIDWARAKKMLKNLRVKTSNTNLEYKICGLSDKKCREQTFSLKLRKEKGSPPTEVEITVYDYFLKHRDMKLTYSADLPCINVGKPKRPTYIPVELCSMVSLQRYTKALSNLQRASLVEKSRQKPQERMDALKQALTVSNYGDDPLLQASGIKICGEFTAIQGRVLQPPKLRVGKGEDFIPRNGRWNFNNKHLVQPMKLDCWVVVNFSAQCDTGKLCRDLSRCAQIKGMSIAPPYDVIEENPQNRRNHPLSRVDEMVGLIKERLPGRPQFILCILAEKKNSDVYGPWKKKILCDMGTFTQCIAPTRVNDQYLTNVLLKINAKLGGINSLLNIEHAETIPLISEIPTLIIGMDVSHGSPGRSDVPSIAAVVSSRQWPLITKYRAAVRTQSPKLEMIDSLFQKVNENGEEIDKGIFRELLMDFYESSNKMKPEQIIIFRDGVSESQFNQVLNQELAQIIEACKFMEVGWSPRFTLVVAQKNHHTKLFQANSRDNVPPGTVVDRGICHPKLNDFYMCAHAGMIGTTRPTHYHVLHDELGFSPDDLQELVHSLSYVYQRSTTAISVVAPVCYAHLAAAQMSQFIKLDDFSDRSSTHSSAQGQGQQGPSIPELPVLHERVSSSMFFC